MINTIVASYILYIFLVAMVLAMILSMFVINKWKIPNKEVHYILILLVLVGVSCLIYIFSRYTEGKPQYSTIAQIIYGCIYGLGFLVSYFFAKYIECILNAKGIKSDKLMLVIKLLVGIGIALDVLSIWNGMYFNVVDGYYTRGPIFSLNQTIAFMIMLYVSCDVFIHRKKLGKTNCIALYSYLVLPTLTVFLQILTPKLMLLYPACVLSLLLIILLSYFERTKEMEEQLLQAKIDILMAQIRPHFLYNSLTSIYRLCDADPAKAKRAVGDFSKYLRNNLESLEKRNMIPFEQELKNIESYLNLELLRYEDRLQVVYHIETKDFQIPVLSIQPLVENAIKHGIGPKEEGGVVKLSTYQTDGGCFVIVEDTGVGFEIGKMKDVGELHVGVENVKKRMESMCGGRMELESEVGKGTKVTIYIPRGIEG